MSSSRNTHRRANLKQIRLDVLFEAICVFVALLLVRALSGEPESLVPLGLISVSIAFVYTALVFALNGYGTSWRFFSLEDAVICLGSVIASSSICAAVFFNVIAWPGWLIVLAGAMAGVTMPRLLVRLANTHDLYGFKAPSAHRNHGDRDSRTAPQSLLMIGFGDHVANFIRSHQRASSEYKIVGLVHIQRNCEAGSLRGVPVLGCIDDLRSIVDKLTAKGRRPDYLVLTRDEMSKRLVGELLSITDKIGIPVAWLPRATQIDENSGQVLRPIKLDDLLPRSANVFDSRACTELLNETTVLVTGAGGSIGSELVRQISGLSPKRLILTDVSEHALYLIDQEISRHFPQVPVTTLLLDVRDSEAVRRAMAAHLPDYVFHAAALKHVPIVEAQACEGVMTNVIGSHNVADASAAAGVKAMVMVSTDKAVNPANVMGASKRLAEAYCQAMDAASIEVKGNTRFVTVRFGNVLGSNGSVVPLFQQQLAHGGPLTVTHPDVERFFMTIPEASRLILQALLLGVADGRGEQGIFVLNMGEPVKIIDLARQVIRLSGLKPERDVKIVYTGLRPGEKLYEELMHETENLLPTEHPSLMVARPRFVQIQTVRSQIEVIKTAAKSGSAEEVLRLLKLFIPEFAVAAKEASAFQGNPDAHRSHMSEVSSKNDQ